MPVRRRGYKFSSAYMLLRESGYVSLIALQCRCNSTCSGVLTVLLHDDEVDMCSQ